MLRNARRTAWVKFFEILVCEELGQPRGVHLSCQDCCNACNRDIVAQQMPVASNSVMGQSVQEGRPHVAPAKRRFGVRFKERRSLKSARIRSRATETRTMTPQDRLSLPWLTKILGLQNSWIVQGAVIKQQGLLLVVKLCWCCQALSVRARNTRIERLSSRGTHTAIMAP